MSRTKALYPETKDFMSYMGSILYWTGVSTLVFIFIGNSIIRIFGWFWCAILTPIMILFTGGMFFSFVVLEDYLHIIFVNIAYFSPLAIIVFAGGIQNILGKGTKYSLFDATKEMVYIPLDKELKIKGKAAVDVLGTKLGKSIGAFIQMMTFTILPAACHEDIAGLLMITFIVVCVIWMSAISILNKSYNNILKQ